jgi:hypothetical protein
MEIAAGLFALGGVALTALLGELRGWRENRIRHTTELATLRRETYIRALHDVEAVASTIGVWSGTMPGSEEAETVSSAPFWAALTTAYKSLNEVRLLGGDQAPALAMMDVLRIYRYQVESGVREVPSAGAQRDALLQAFRRDLALQ